MVDRETHRRWAEAFSATARAHWTPERTREVAGDKRLAVLPAEAPLLLRAMGLLHRDATMPPSQVRKFLQINHMVGLLRTALEEVRARRGRLRILDAGCGRSYLSLLVAHVARAAGEAIDIVGVDRDPDVIEECRRRTAIAELDGAIRYVAAPLAEVDHGDIDAVISLHACDTATCDAIALGVRAGVELIAVAPCCQAELARAWAASPGGAFAPIHRAPHLRRELAAHVTDAMRTLLLRACGYATTPMEFIADAHTKKNTLLRALRASPDIAERSDGVRDPAARAEYDALVAATGGHGLALASRVS